MTYHYLATPYSKYPYGLDAAFELACMEAGRLIKAGIPTFSPIAHSHPIAMNAGINPLSHEIWLPADESMMRGAAALIVLRAESWEESYGMKEEIRIFTEVGKPIIYMDPGVIPDELCLVKAV